MTAKGRGALAGAWLGFHATADIAALVTAIVGAAVGANLSSPYAAAREYPTAFTVDSSRS